MNDSDDSIYLPEELVTASPGFTLDIGASTAKIIYRSKLDYRNGVWIGDSEKDDTESEGLSRLKFCKLPCDDTDQIIALIRNHCDITRQEEVPEVIVTGNGCNRHKEVLEKELQIRMNILSEFDMAVDGALLLLKTSKETFWPLAEDPQRKAEKNFKQVQDWIKSGTDQTRQKWLMMQDIEETLSWKPDTSKTFPFLLVTCGSGFGFDKIFPDGRFERVDHSLFGGRSILGLLNQLTNEKDFDKLIDMASSSNGRTTDLFGSDIAKQSSESDAYSALDQDDMVLFPFGKAYDNNDVNKGDMAHSLFNIVSLNLSQISHLVATVHDCPLVVFTGNLVTSQFMRDSITFEMKLRNLGSPASKRVNFGFMKHGGYLTAIGAFAAGAK